MDLRKLKTLIDLVAESGISELEITEGDGKVRIVKSQPGPVTMQAPMQMAAPAAAAPATAVAAPAPAAAVAAPAAPEGHLVKSPMVPHLRNDALMSLEISFFFSALFRLEKARPLGRISDSSARPTVVSTRLVLGVNSPVALFLLYSVRRTLILLCSSTTPASSAR